MFDPELADGPSAAELAEIDREWPLIAAELELLDAEIAAVSVPGSSGGLAFRRVRRAERRVLEARRELAAGERFTFVAAGRGVA